MQGDFGFASPHGPCIIKFLTASNVTGSLSLSGISAHIISSVCEGLRCFPFSFPSRNISIWACGSPLFWNSIVKMTAFKKNYISKLPVIKKVQACITDK
uniref:Uncharacterized protein n=1 Tax=Triticum urartu TaxID=4572 RepID=A0A8R7JZ92_TRIUA